MHRKEAATTAAGIESTSSSPTKPTSTDNATTTPPRRVAPRESANSSPPAHQVSKSSPLNASGSPELVALQRQHSRLLSQLSKLKQQLDTAQQALRLGQSGQDIELRILVDRWKSTSREAAEEVFREAKDKVNRMGGVGVWRERTTRRPYGWEEDGEPDLEGLTEEQKEEIQFRKQEMAEEAEKYGLNKPEEPPGKDDDVGTRSYLPFDVLLTFARLIQWR